MPDVLPTINNEPAQGIQAQLDTVYLWNPDVANELIEQVNELLAEIGELENLSGKIKPYSQMTAPVLQYMPTTYNDGLYVATNSITTLPAEFDPTQWTLIATKIDRQSITREIEHEAELRAGADANLQDQIDVLVASSDVTDIVGTHAELEEYDTSKLKNNDIIKVLQDETQDDATTYYRWSTTDEVFSLIGSEGPYYTQAQTDSLLDEKQDELTAGEGITIENNVISANASGDYVPQYETMPTATAQNVGELMQYSGPTIADTQASATAEQTVGSSLSNIVVNVKTFEAEEEPTGDETVEFVASVSAGGGFAPQALIQGTEDKYAYFDTAKLIAYIATYTDHTDYKYVSARHRGTDNNDITMWMNSRFSDSSWTNYKQVTGLTDAQMTAAGITFSDYTFYSSNKAQSDYTSSVTIWTKDGEGVMPSSYGITFSGVPADGDTIEVHYTAFKKGYTQGCFYLCSVLRTDPTVGIAQISGDGLYDLAVDLDTFVAEEQPTQSENVDFLAVVDNVLGEPTNDYGEPVEWSATLDSDAFTAAYEDATGASIDDLPSYSSFLYNGSDWFLQTDTAISVSDPSEWGFYPTGTLYNGSRIGVSRGSPYWTKDSVVVDIADYGITYSGTPDDGDELRVFYTASTISGYEWKQINVQPSVGGIEWKSKVDLPADYYGTTWNARPYYVIAGGLPTGTYEFYFATKVSTGEINNKVLGEVTFKVICNIDVERQKQWGRMGYVFNGDYMNDGNFIFGSSDQTIGLFYGSGSDLIISTDNRPFSTDLLDYGVTPPVKDCFKLSAIKNIETGEEYIAEGHINLDGSVPVSTTYYDGHIILVRLVEQPYIPEYHNNFTWGYSNDAQYARLQPYQGIAHDGDYASCSELDIVLKSSNGGRWHCVVENSRDSYVARLLEASEDLANVQIGWNSSGTTYLYFNTTAGTSGTIYGSIGAKGSSQAAGGWLENPDTFTPAVITEIGGTVTVDNLGMILQYEGPTTVSYTNGFFYKATGTEVQAPATCTPYNVSPNDFTITIDAAALVPAMSSTTGWAPDDIKRRLNQGFEWRIDYDADNNTINSVYWSNYGTFTASDILSCFTVSTTGSYSGYVSIYFYTNYTDAHTEIQNGHWERIDTQPAADPLPSQTGNAGKVLMTNGTTASWETPTTVTFRTWGANE